jgi:TRAP-type C4-dicarboxylate transport system substrate-binding protein
MPNAMTRLIAVAVLMAPFAVKAEPVELKLSYYGSDQALTYRSGIKPFVDGINAEGQGLLAIHVYFNGALGKAIADQPQLVIDGVADIAYVIPGQTPYRFPDNELLEQPGLFRDARDGTLAYTRLIAAGALRGYQDFFVIGAYTAAPNLIHSREPISSLASIKGQKLRVNNPVEAEALGRLGAVPNVLDAQKVANAIAKGALDGTSMSPIGVYEFGVEQVAKNHYLLRSGVAPLLVLMNRKTFESLPEAAQALVRKYSGERAAASWIGSFGATETETLERLKSDPDHKVVEPSPSDLDNAHRTFRTMVDAWAAHNNRNRAILDLAEAQLATIRSDR